MEGNFAAFLLLLQVEFPEVKLPVVQVRLRMLPAIALELLVAPIYWILSTVDLIVALKVLPSEDAESRVSEQIPSRPREVLAGGWWTEHKIGQ